MEIPRKIEGEKINLRWHVKADAMSIYNQIGDKEVSQYTFIPYPYKLEDAYDYIKFSQSARRKKTAYNYGLEQKKTRRIIGGIGLENIDWTHRRGEIGYWLAKPFWGRGIMVEAIELMLAFCFRNLGLHRVHAQVFPPNAASIRVLEKTGFTCEGLIREGSMHRGEYVDAYLYAILEDEWARRQ